MDLANRVLYVTNAKKMHTPGSSGYALNRLLFPPKDLREKGMEGWSSFSIDF